MSNGNKANNPQEKTKKVEKEKPETKNPATQWTIKTRLQIIIIDSPNAEIISFVHSEFLSIISSPFHFRPLPGYYSCTSLTPTYTDNFHFVFQLI